MVRILRGTVSCLSVFVLLVAAAGAADPTDELLQALMAWEAAAADVRPTVIVRNSKSCR